jgi:hypothetical protein
MKPSEVRVKIERDINKYDDWQDSGFKGEVKEAFTDEELGINKNDYLNEDGIYKDYTGNKYHNDRDYEIFKIFYNIMKPTKEDFYTLRYYLKKEYDYSFVKSPSLRYLLFGETFPETGDNDKYFCLLDIEIRKIMQKLIPKMIDKKKRDVNKEVCARVKKILDTDYILTKKENDKTFMLLLIAEKEN